MQSVTKSKSVNRKANIAKREDLASSKGKKRRELFDAAIGHSKTRLIVNKETSTSSSCPLPLSILKSIPHVVMRTISDEEAKKAQIKVQGTKYGCVHKKKVQQGGENTGRWTKEEHGVFLLGLEKHGKEWKEISHMIPTRSVVQIRTHAQKYFQKVAKSRAREGKLDPKSGEHSQIVSTASSTVSFGTHNKRKRVSKKLFKKDSNLYQKKLSQAAGKRRRKKTHKKARQIMAVEELQATSPLVIKAPCASSTSIAAAFVEVFDDNINGTPKSVAELFDMEISVRQPKVISSELPFLEEDIDHFDFESGSDATTENYASSHSTSPFEQSEILFSKAMKSNIIGKSVPSTEGFLTFSDLDMEIEKSSFIVDLSDSVDYPNNGLVQTEGKCYRGSNMDSYQGISEEEFISGLLA